jgi:hypothetical protein
VLALFCSLQLIRIEQPGGVVNRQEIGALLFDAIHEAVASQNNLSNGWVAKFRNTPTGLGELSDALDSLEQVNDEKARVLDGILGDESSDGIQVLRSLGCPSYFNHRFIFCLIFSWGIVWPTSAC